MKKLFFAAAIMIAIAVAVFFQFGDKENGVKYKTGKVTRGDVRQTVSATGTVNAVVNVSVGTQVSGSIKEIFVDFNSTVKQGQIIARIDPAMFEAQTEQARANLMAAKANLQKSEAAMIDAKRKMTRKIELFSKNLIAQSDAETSETDYQSAVAQVNLEKARIAQARAALKYAETNLAYTKIVSPVDGIVVSRNVDAGQTVAASFQTPTLFAIAQDLAKMQIDTNVDEADIGKIMKDQDVNFTVDAYPDIVFQGKVWQIRNAPITVENVVTYDAVIKVDNSELKLKPGMTANVSVITARKENVLKVANAALRFKPPDARRNQSDWKGYGVWVLKNGDPERIDITPGVSDGIFTEIISSNLKENQEVIIESAGRNVKGSQGSRGLRMF